MNVFEGVGIDHEFIFEHPMDNLSVCKRPEVYFLCAQRAEYGQYDIHTLVWLEQDGNG